MKKLRKLKGFSTGMGCFMMTAFFAGATLFTSCTDDDLAGGKDTPENTDAERLLVNNNVEELSKRVTLFKTDGAQTRAAGDGYLTMPEQPTVPDDAVDMTQEGFKDWDPVGSAFVLRKGDSKTSESLNLNGAEWFVEGELTVKAYNNGEGNGKIYILPGGKLTYKNETLDKVEIYNFGGDFIPENNLTINANSVYMTKGSFSLTEKLSIAGQLYVSTDFAVPILDVNGAAGKVFVGGNATFEEEGEVTNYASMYVEGKLTSPRFEVNSSGEVTSACSAVFNEHFYLTNGSSFNVLAGGYVKSPNTKLDSNCHLKVAENGYLDLGKLYIPNANTASIEAISDDEFAVVKATSIEVNMKDLKSTFKGNLGLHYESIIYSDTTYTGSDVQENFDFIANIQHNGDDDTYIPASDCNPGFGTGSTDPDPDQPGGGEEGGGENPDPDQPGGGDDEGDDDGRIIIDHVAEISPSEHAHDISATCVYMDEESQYAYVSWHKRGEEYDGCAEVIQFTDENTLKLVSFMRSERRRDFNHCIVDNNTLYLVGGQGTGGIIAKVPLKNHIFDEATETTTSQGIFDVVKIPNSGDANCVVRNGNYYMVAATGGFYTLDAEDLGNVTMVQETPGSAKFIDLKNNKMLTLNLDARGTEAAGAEINVYNQADYTLSGTPSPTINENKITPINGKNVARLDGNNIYVCLGENGLQRYTNGTANGNFKLSGTNSLVNGMDFDDKYIYVAYGSKGLYVLDKNTLEVMASYKYAGGKSANYVKVVNGHIFVAYGRSGLQVFKLTKVKN